VERKKEGRQEESGTRGGGGPASATPFGAPPLAEKGLKKRARKSKFCGFLPKRSALGAKSLRKPREGEKFTLLRM